MNVLDIVKSSLFPVMCVRCGREGVSICADCETKLVTVSSPACPFCHALTFRGETCEKCRRKYYLKGAFVGLRVSDTARALIHKLKFEHRRDIAKILAPYLVRSFKELGADMDEALLVPIPADRKRAKDRLYNPPDLLAAELSRHLGLKVIKLLTKKISTPPQSALGRGKRLENLKSAFAVKDSDLRGATIVLVDDVATTFSTTEAAALALKEARPRRIWGAVIAHRPAPEKEFDAPQALVNNSRR